MNTKELFLANEDLRNKLIGVTRTDWFKQALVYVDSVTIQEGIGTSDFIKGANAFRDTLLTIGDKDEEPPRISQPGLVDLPTRNSTTSKTEPKKG